MEETSIKNNQPNKKVLEPSPRQSKIVLTNQNELTINGVSKVVSSTESLIQAVINEQVLEITGEKLQILKIDVENGVLEAMGNFISFKFACHKQKQNFFKRIFG